MRNHHWALAICAVMALTVGTSVIAADKSKAKSATTKAAVDVTHGKMVFDQWCLGCHARMAGMAGPFGFPPAGTNMLQKKYKDTVPSALEDRIDLSPDLIRVVVRQGLPIMPPLRKTEVTDADLEAVIAYLTQKKRK
jgi:mono/diheme cytochrome c family protein